MNAADYTWEDVVQFYFPNLDREECHDILMSATAYPFSGIRYTCRQLDRKSRQVKDVPEGEKLHAAIGIAHQEMEEDFEKYVRPRMQKKKLTKALK